MYLSGLIPVHAETRRRGGIETVNYTVKSLFESCCTKIDKTNGKTHQSKISQ